MHHKLCQAQIAMVGKAFLQLLRLNVLSRGS